ncbi:hypothetical protein FQZ97_1036870 [compost metagenome]
MNDLFFIVAGVEAPAVLPAHVEGAFRAVEIDAHVLGFALGSSVQVGMLPDAVKIFEIIHDDLAFGGVIMIGFYLIGRSRINAFGGGFLRPPEDLVEPVRPPVAGLAVGKLRPLPPVPRVDSAAVRNQGSRPAP